MVKVGGETSTILLQESGTPQGSVLSLLLYIIYTADLELWTNNACVIGYADDTSISVQEKN